MELKILNIICEEIKAKFNKQAIELGKQIGSELEKKLKDYKINQIENAYEFSSELLKTDIWLAFLSGFVFSPNEKPKEPKPDYKCLIDSDIDITELDEYNTDQHYYKWEYEYDAYYDGFIAAMWGKPEGECPHKPSGYERMLTFEDECCDAWIDGHSDGCEYIEKERKKGNIK